jgi:hypothetical protein
MPDMGRDFTAPGSLEQAETARSDAGRGPPKSAVTFQRVVAFCFTFVIGTSTNSSVKFTL